MSEITSDYRREARNSDTPRERLEELANTDVLLARLVASNEGAPGNLLAELGDHADRAVRRRVVRNPATPAKVAAQVGSEFPNDLLDNPAFDLYLLEEPDLLDGIGEATLRALLKRDRCPPGFFAYAARKGDAAIALAVLTNPSIPAELVKEMRDTEYWGGWNFKGPFGQAEALVREACALHQIVAPAAKKWRATLQAAIAAARLHGRPRPSQASLARLAIFSGGDAPGLLAPVDRLKSVPLELYKAALECPAGRAALAGDNDTPTEILRELTERVDQLSARPLLSNEAAAMLWTAATLTSAFRAAGENFFPYAVQLPPDLMVLLPAAEFPEAVAWGLRESRTLPSDLKSYLSHDRTRQAVASHRALPAGLFEQLAAQNPVAIGANPSAPFDLLLRLARHELPDVRRAVARNLAVDDRILAGLADDPDTGESGASGQGYDDMPSVREVVANHLLAAPGTLIRLGHEAETELARILAKRSDAPPALLDMLAQHPDVEVRSIVAKHPNTVGATLALLADDPDDGEKTMQAYNSRHPVRAFVAANPNTPSAALARLASDPDTGWEFGGRGNRHWNRPSIREVVADNPSIDNATLDRLANIGGEALVWRLVRNPRLDVDQMVQWLRNPRFAKGPKFREQICGALLDRAGEVPDDVFEDLIAALMDVDASFGTYRLNNLAISPKRRAEMQRALATHADEGMRRSVANQESCFVPLLMQLSRDADEWVREAVAQNPNTPPEVLQLLGQDDHARVRVAVAVNTRTPASLDNMVQAEEARAGQKGSPSWKPRSELQEVHAALARNRRTPLTTLKRLARGNDIEVLTVLAKRASVPREMRALALETLAQGGEGKDGHKAVCFAASHPDTPVIILETMLCSPDREISRRARANKALGRARAHPSTVSAIRVRPADAERIEQALDAGDAPGALAVLRSEWLDELARPNAPSLSRLLALMQPDCAPARLAKAQRSVWWAERCAIAVNPSTPVSVVQRLAGDANVVVRAAAREALTRRGSGVKE